MDISLKLKDILQITTILKNEIEQCENIPVKFNLLNIVAGFKSYCDNYEEMRLKLIERYGTIDEEGNYTIAKNTDAYNDFRCDINQMLDNVYDLKVNKIKFSDISNLDADSLIILYPILME